MNIWLARVIWFFVSWTFWYFAFFGIGQIVVKVSDKEIKDPRFKNKRYRLTYSFLITLVAFVIHYM